MATKRSGYSRPKAAPKLKPFKVKQPKLGTSTGNTKNGKFSTSKPIKANTKNPISSPRQQVIKQMIFVKARKTK